MTEHFYWLEDGAIAGCSRPGQPRPTAPQAESMLLDLDLGWLRRQGIGAVLSLTETPLDAEALERNDLESLHLPVPDMTPPLPEQIDRALGFIDWQRAQGRAVAVHCLVGQGRTGTILAAYLIRQGMRPAGAIAHLRQLCPGAIGSPSQEVALEAYGRRRDWVL